MTVPAIAFRSGLLALHIYGAPTDFRIELASSPDTSPMFLAMDGDRINWIADRDAADTFPRAALAWDFCFAKQLPLVRVRN